MYDDDQDLIGQVSDEDDLDDDDEHMMEQDPHDDTAANGRHPNHEGNGKSSNGGDRRDQPAPQQPQPAKQAQPQATTGAANRSRRSRLSDHVDDEPPLRGYKRYVGLFRFFSQMAVSRRETRAEAIMPKRRSRSIVC